MVNFSQRPSATKRNGVLSHLQRYLDALGDWSTYRHLSGLDEIPARLAQVTYTFLGLGGLLEGQPRLSGLLGLVIAVHFLEQLTGGLATAGLGLAGRGQPLARYRGILIRRSPFSRWAYLLNHLPGLRVRQANGYYFVESGRTWHCQSVTFELADSRRTLTRLRSLSLPHREYLFDRPVTVPGEREPAAGEKTIAIQRVIDTVKGAEAPEAIAGFIGCLNELESLVPPLTSAKQFLFMANWLLIAPTERDDGSGYVDYDSLARGNPPGGPGSNNTWQTPPLPGNGPRTGWPSTSRTPAASGAAFGSAPTGRESGVANPGPIPLRQVNPAGPQPPGQPIPLTLIRPAPSINSHRPPPPPPNFPDNDVVNV